MSDCSICFLKSPISPTFPFLSPISFLITFNCFRTYYYFFFFSLYLFFCSVSLIPRFPRLFLFFPQVPFESPSTVHVSNILFVFFPLSFLRVRQFSFLNRGLFSH